MEFANVEILHNSRAQFFPLGGSPAGDGGKYIKISTKNGVLQNSLYRTRIKEQYWEMVTFSHTINKKKTQQSI